MSNRENPQPLRILWVISSSFYVDVNGTYLHSFVDQFNFVDPHLLKAEPSLELNTTAYWMRQRFGVSPLFFSLIFSPNYVVPPGNASLMRFENEKCVAIGEQYGKNLKPQLIYHICPCRWFLPT